MSRSREGKHDAGWCPGRGRESMMQCDVLVVGAGPAGASAALAAAKGGAHVILVDKRRSIGEPVQCAEWIPKLLSREVHIPNPVVVQEVSGMNTHFPDGTIHETKAPGLMIDRKEFDRMLVDRAMENGVTLLLETRAISRMKNTVILRQSPSNERMKIEPKIIIGADGPRSTVGKWIGSVNTIFVQGLQYTLPLVEPMDVTEVHFQNDIYGGYGWVFPKGETANVGIGIRVKRGSRSMPHLRTVLDNFATKLLKEGKVRFEKGSIQSVQAGLIPVGGPLPSQLDTILLAGDAAGHTNPITGAGITQAVTCGTMAGKTSARVIETDDHHYLLGYERKWRMLYGTLLDRAIRRRRFMESHWKDLNTIVPSCWPAFREYYHESNEGTDVSEDDTQKDQEDNFLKERELEYLGNGDLEEIIDQAHALRHETFGNRITFYHPGMINYMGRYGKYQAVSITGGECGLQCDHCQSKLLGPMIHAPTPESLVEKCRKLDEKGDIGCLLSGGSDQMGRLPWKRFIPAINEIKESTSLFLSAHSGIIDLETAQHLKEAGIDQALIDIIAEDDSIRQIYHADYTVKDIESSLHALTSAGIPIIPHIIVGLNEWRISGELKAIRMVEKLNPRPQAMVVVSFMPLPGTPMAHDQPPGFRDIARILAAIRIRIPDMPLFLGCARDRGNDMIDTTAIRCGVNGIVLPSDSATSAATKYDLDIKWKQTCCSVPFLSEDE